MGADVAEPPEYERLRLVHRLAHLLNGITIAVGGVIAALAVFVAQHAAFSNSDPGGLIMPLAAVAFIGVRRFRIGVVTTVEVLARWSDSPPQSSHERRAGTAH
jgi:hypothetical protein